ncbi:MAG: class I SAM-dependent methyltransferase [Planctomycetia bacterium]
MRDARDDWRSFDAKGIPSKDSTPHLDAFLAAVAKEAVRKTTTVVDVGCGSGLLSRRICEQGFSVLGVDINPEAIKAARGQPDLPGRAGRWLRFEVADFATDASPRLDGCPFDVAVCQLVISIIGTLSNRTNLLRHVHDILRPGGRLFLSASGVSETINPGYARLYADDFVLTGERHTYLSRDAGGKVLYMTHHFTDRELHDLLEDAGFDEISVTTERETSSRRPEEAAFFLYATGRAAR